LTNALILTILYIDQPFEVLCFLSRIGLCSYAE